jgi:outer membrane phospholipase A
MYIMFDVLGLKYALLKKNISCNEFQRFNGIFKERLGLLVNQSYTLTQWFQIPVQQESSMLYPILNIQYTLQNFPKVFIGFISLVSATYSVTLPSINTNHQPE